MSDAEPILPPSAISIPLAVTLNLCVPPVVIATSSAALKNTPVFVSPVFVIDGADALPSANDATPVIDGPARVTTEDVALRPDVNAVPVPSKV